MNQQQLVQDRIRKVVAIVIVIFLLFGLRLIDIQAIRAKGFVDRADNELSKSATLLAPRGTIFDVNGVFETITESLDKVEKGSLFNSILLSVELFLHPQIINSR